MIAKKKLENDYTIRSKLSTIKIRGILFEI